MIEILYDSRDFLVCVKPYGIISQYDESKPNMVDLLCKQLCCDIFPVHRLDRTTAGVMVYAKNKNTAALLTKQITDGVFKKEYLALINGVLSESGSMEDFLFFDRSKNKSYVVSKERKGVKYAKLMYVPVRSENGRTLLKIQLLTGRTHQIRAQFSSRGLSLCGDHRYGAKDTCKNIALWSYGVVFKNPQNDETVTFYRRPTEDFGI